MNEQLTPRQMIKGLLQGNRQARPLIVPIVFALGARIENLSYRAYLDNPTKISNALRQIRTQFRTDGVSCYLDSLLEAEALGGGPEWDEANQARSIRWPESAQKGELPARLRSPEEAANSPRVRAAVEVIRRLNSLLRDEPLLIAGVSGPFTLAARLTGIDPGAMRQGQEPSEPVLEVAAAVITEITSALVEAGANLIFIREDVVPPLSPNKCQNWTSLLAPLFNIVRFYEALPVLQISGESATAENVEVILQQSWDAVLCSASEEFIARAHGHGENLIFGCSVPLQALEASDSSGARCLELSGIKPALVTTDGDVPATADLKRLMSVIDSIARRT
ncbi:MAG TPA: uroporphyrinogen decarboxylase family protein [Candidatus Dormibacteraeota bacterium]|nr:uroporphyrinogen decarboxylase family protein [Candidatus Dormibacteraeota bacterium]